MTTTEQTLAIAKALGFEDKLKGGLVRITDGSRDSYREARAGLTGSP